MVFVVFLKSVQLEYGQASLDWTILSANAFDTVAVEILHVQKSTLSRTAVLNGLVMRRKRLE